MRNSGRVKGGGYANFNTAVSSKAYWSILDRNRIFFSRIQISVQFLGNLSHRQMLGGRVIRLRSFFKGSASGIKSAEERGSRGVDGYQSWLVSVGAYNAFMASA